MNWWITFGWGMFSGGCLGFGLGIKYAIRASRRDGEDG